MVNVNCQLVPIDRTKGAFIPFLHHSKRFLDGMQPRTFFAVLSSSEETVSLRRGDIIRRLSEASQDPWAIIEFPSREATTCQGL